MRIFLSVLLTVLTALSAGLRAEEPVDLNVVHRIRHEAATNSRVMDYIFQLVDVHGPRLTGSPGFQGAADWTVQQLKEWGLDNVKQEKWGPFGQGWSIDRFSAHLVEPQYELLIGVPLGWSPSTAGVVNGTPVLAPLRRESNRKRDDAAVDAFIKEYKGKLGKHIVLIAPLKDVKPQAEPALRRWSHDELAERATALKLVPPIDFDDPDLEVPTEPEKRRDFFRQAPRWFREQYRKEGRRIQNKLNRFLVDEEVVLVMHPAARGDGGTVFPPRAGSRIVEDVVPPPSIAITPEQYNRIYRLTDKNDKKISPRVEVEVRTQFHRDDLDSVNVIAELPGAQKKDELVMIGAHLDSTAQSLGATDNAAGSAVMMEVVRILNTLKVPLARTVRLALWGGEEQGLLGSEAYVKEHFGDPETMRLTGRHQKLAAYFNFDNGTGKIRGVYLQGNDMVRPIFKAWLEPFEDMGATTLSIRDTGGTDHLPFNWVGLPGFQFIQDPVEYETRTHHSNMDMYDRIQPGDLMQASAIIASFVYHAANRDEMLPRKPLPPLQPKQKPAAE